MTSPSTAVATGSTARATTALVALATSQACIFVSYASVSSAVIVGTGRPRLSVGYDKYHPPGVASAQVDVARDSRILVCPTDPGGSDQLEIFAPADVLVGFVVNFVLVYESAVAKSGDALHHFRAPSE